MKILHFFGVCVFVDGLWSEELIVTNSKEIQPEDLEIPLPVPFEEMNKCIVGKIPTYPQEGINEIEGWIFCDSIPEGNDVLESFAKQFCNVQNKPKEDPFLGFLKGMLDTLKELRSEVEKDMESQKKHEIGHESEG